VIGHQLDHRPQQLYCQSFVLGRHGALVGLLASNDPVKAITGRGQQHLSNGPLWDENKLLEVVEEAFEHLAHLQIFGLHAKDLVCLQSQVSGYQR